mgnify:CR=1 FL=1
MRGKVRVGEAYSRAYRITPAYAGKSPKRHFSAVNFKDHPRLCGEKLYDADDISNYYGSPPPMRGKGTGLVFNAGNVGITPAYAGKSPIPYMLNDIVKDHPRLCGEKRFSVL